MDTVLDCMPCFMKMAVRESRLACPDNEALQLEIVAAWGALLPTLDLSQSPPAIARHLAALVREKTGCGDLYEQDKVESNHRVAALLPDLEARLEQEFKGGSDPLALALEIAIIGNYIDRGVELEFDLEGELATVAGGISPEVVAEFTNLAQPGKEIMILGDNSGEIVLDTLLVKELLKRGCRVVYVVRSNPVINDATMKDAKAVGMTELCEVLESGVDTPGTVLDRCDPAFLERMHHADVILSKGQGNFEALNNTLDNIFCAFKVKCSRVSLETGLTLGKSAFCRTPVVAGGLG